MGDGTTGPGDQSDSLALSGGTTSIDLSSPDARWLSSLRLAPPLWPVGRLPMPYGCMIYTQDAIRKQHGAWPDLPKALGPRKRAYRRPGKSPALRTFSLKSAH
jgi:hypothetical protein